MATQSLPILFIPDKQKTATDPTDLPTAFRTIERWANHITLQAGITQITSVDGSVTITNPTGPTTDLHVATGGGGAPYASLTGPGYTVTPGDLTQAGGFTVNGGASNVYLQGATSTLTSPVAGGTVRIITGVTASPGGTGIKIADSTTSGGFLPNGSGGVAITSTNGQVTINSGNYPAQITSNYGVVLQASPYGNRFAKLWTLNGPPSGGSAGSITPTNPGEFCFDTATPGLWVSTGTTTASWVMYTLP